MVMITVTITSCSEPCSSRTVFYSEVTGNAASVTVPLVPVTGRG